MLRLIKSFKTLLFVLGVSGFLPILRAQTVYLDPGNEDMKRSVLPTDCSNRDLRGAVIDIDMYEHGYISNNFDESNLEGSVFGGSNYFVGASFKNANLRGVYIHSLDGNENAIDNANITGAWIHTTENFLKNTRNYKEKDLSNTTISFGRQCDFSDFNLQRTYFNGYVDNAIFNNSNITNAVFQSIWTYAGQTMTIQSFHSLTPEQLYTTKNFKEKNLGSVIFIFADFRNADFRDQTLGYFDGCNLEGADLTNAFFATRDERTLPPFAKNNPIGLTDCKITIEQFKQTRNFKIWKDRGVPEIKRILVTGENAGDYNYHNLYYRELIAEYFENPTPGIPVDEKRKALSPSEKFYLHFPLKGEIYLYQVGNMFVTKEIAEVLEKEREQQIQSNRLSYSENK
jgi:uncharacterized protein YjbI with pentapeptide repeats